MSDHPTPNPTDATSPSPAPRPPIIVCTLINGRWGPIYFDGGSDVNARPIGMSIMTDGDDPVSETPVEVKPIAVLPGRFFGAVLEHDRRAAAYASDLLDTAPEPTAC